MTSAMPANTPDQWRLTQLNQRIDQLQAESEGLQSERVVQSKSAGRAARRLRYLRMIRRLRAPAASFELWPIGVLVVGPVFIGGLLLVAAHFITGSLGAGILAFVLGAVAGAALLASMLYRPPDALLPAGIDQAASEHRLAQSRLQDTVQRLTAAQAEHAALIEERRLLMASGQVQRAALLQREWKTMPEAEWEDFVVEVCRTLGASVERTPRSTEPDANLVGQFAARRVAILTRGEGRTVNSASVQHALAGQQRHTCDLCAIIINRRFTGAAQDFAGRQGCTLIGVEEFPDFVMGKIELGT